jgi:phosphate acetyltransferase
MGNSLYISITESGSGKALIALGPIELILRKAAKVSFFRPVIQTTQTESKSGNLLTARDEDIELILQHFNLPQTDAESFGLRLPYGKLCQRAAKWFTGTTSD